jgi:hypothetical protein
MQGSMTRSAIVRDVLGDRGDEVARGEDLLKTLECRHRRRSVCDPSRSAAMLFRATLLHYLAGFDGCGELRRSLNSLTSVEAVMAAVDRVLGPP